MERLANAPAVRGGGAGAGAHAHKHAYGAGAPEFIDGVAMAADSAVVVVGEGCDEPPAGDAFAPIPASDAT